MARLLMIRSRNVLYALLAYFILSLICTQIPLLNYLGYEFSSLLALVSSLISGFLSFSIVRQYRADASDKRRGFQQALMANLAILVVPLVVMLTNTLFVKNCSVMNGVVFFLLLPLVSAWFSTCLAFFCTMQFRHPRVIFVGLFCATVAYAAAIGYYTPAIYSYNFFYGYFPGLTYDEVLELSWTLVLFRVLTFFLGLGILWLGLLIAEHTSLNDSTIAKGVALVRLFVDPRKGGVALLVAAAVFFLYVFRGELGFESSAQFIRDELGERFESEHFAIFYSKSSFSSEEIRWVAAEHEFRLAQINNIFHLRFHERIQSYIYPSAETKRRYLGTRTTSIAKPWSGQIHLSVENLQSVLKHELVHVLAAPFGVPVIRTSLHPGLTEGLAMAIEWSWGNRTLHEYAAIMKRSGIEPDMEQIMGSTGFLAQSSSVSYVLAGSFCRFLIDSYGIRSMTKVYRSGDYQGTFGRSLSDLIADWRAELDTIHVGANAQDIVDVFFRRLPIFHKVCARVVAQLNAEAGAHFAKKDYSAAAGLFHLAYSEGKGNEALGGYFSSELRLGHTSSLTAALDTIILRHEAPGRFLSLFLPIGDAFWKEGDIEKARDLYKRVVFADIADAYSEAAAVRLLAIGDSTARDELLNYFLSDEVDSIRLRLLDSVLVRLPGNPVALYLKGKLLSRLGKHQDAVRILLPLDLKGGHLDATRLKTIGKALFKLKRFQEARSFFWQSLNAVSTRATIDEVNEWVDRCEWSERNSMP